ncbi:MAG: hypothetical protein AAGA30_08480, partial [Planctomycetota bacterium]
EERMSDAAMRTKFGQSIMAQVDRTMTRYDRDKNGLIDPKEQTRTRWTNPSADESDTNKDKNLSRLELAYRYKKREEEALKRSRKKNASRSSTSRTSKIAKSSKASTSKNSASRYRNSRYSSSTTNKSSSSSERKGFNTGSDAYKRYAEGLLKNYDKNKDGRLSKKELEEMRRPPKNADTNGDGYIDKNELISSVNRKSTSKSSEGSSSSSAKSKVLDGKRRDPKKSYNERDTIFGGKDTNNDRQLQMKEFADSQDWNEELVAEFKEKDFNGDGVITESEWVGKR